MVSFMVELSGEAPRRFRVAPGKRPVKVGRGPKNDIVLGMNGVSAHHLDLLAVESSDGPMLAVRDVSMNGTCILTVRGASPERLTKDITVEVVDSAVLLLPFKVKPDPAKRPEEQRVSMRLTVLDRTGAPPVAEQRKREVSAMQEEMMKRCMAFAQQKEREREAEAHQKPRGRSRSPTPKRLRLLESEPAPTAPPAAGPKTLTMRPPVMLAQQLQPTVMATAAAAAAAMQAMPPGFAMQPSLAALSGFLSQQQRSLPLPPIPGAATMMARPSMIPGMTPAMFGQLGMMSNSMIGGMPLAGFAMPPMPPQWR